MTNLTTREATIRLVVDRLVNDAYDMGFQASQRGLNSAEYRSLQVGAQVGIFASVITQLIDSVLLASNRGGFASARQIGKTYLSKLLTRHSFNERPFR